MDFDYIMEFFYNFLRAVGIFAAFIIACGLWGYFS